MGMLRESIEAKIREANGNPETAAIEICRLLEDLVGFEEKGYFDDDADLRAVISRGRQKTGG